MYWTKVVSSIETEGSSPPISDADTDRADGLPVTLSRQMSETLKVSLCVAESSSANILADKIRNIEIKTNHRFITKEDAKHHILFLIWVDE